MNTAVKNIGLMTVALASVSMLGPFATDTYLPSFFQIGQDFAVTQAQVQQTLSVYLLGYAVMSLFHGTLSDTFGRKPVMIWGLVIFMIGSVGCMLAPSFGWLLFFRGVQGISAGVGMIIGQAMVRDKFDGPVAQKLMANIMMVFGLAPAIAPVIGGYISGHMSWRATFGFLVVFTVYALVIASKVLTETHPAEKRTPFQMGLIFRNYLTALKNRQFLFGAFAASLCFSAMGLYISSAAVLIIQILGLGETDFHWLFLPLISGVVLGSAMNGRLASRLPSQRIIVLGFSSMLTGLLVNVFYNLFFTAALPWATFPLFLYTFGMAMAMPTIALATMGIFPQMRGLASSLISFFQMTVFAVIAGVIAPLLFGSALHIAVGGLVGVTLSAVCWFGGVMRVANKK